MRPSCSPTTAFPSGQQSSASPYSPTPLWMAPSSASPVVTPAGATPPPPSRKARVRYAVYSEVPRAVPTRRRSDQEHGRQAQEYEEAAAVGDGRDHDARAERRVAAELVHRQRDRDTHYRGEHQREHHGPGH